MKGLYDHKSEIKKHREALEKNEYDYSYTCTKDQECIEEKFAIYKDESQDKLGKSLLCKICNGVF